MRRISSEFASRLRKEQEIVTKLHDQETKSMNEFEVILNDALARADRTLARISAEDQFIPPLISARNRVTSNAQLTKTPDTIKAGMKTFKIV